jgi:hypothetical protein
MNAGSWLPVLLAVQGVLGGIDTLYNHEWVEHLPRRPSARREIGLHCLREANYGAMFVGLGWFQWHGALAWIVAAALAAEVLITAIDEFEENRTRVLPQNERVLHVFLTLNLGLIVALAVPALAQWSTEPTALVALPRGALTWLLTLLGLSGFAWSARDALAWRRLGAAA